MNITLERCTIRSLEEDDAGSLAMHANNWKVWRGMKDTFPHPYRLEDARTFIEMAKACHPERHFAIAVDGAAVGAVGFEPNDKGDAFRASASIAYWIGESFCGRGIVAEAVVAATEYAVRTFDLARVYAAPFAGNGASCRVVEKAGYVFEGRLRRSVIKDGEIADQLMYAWVKPD